MRYYCEMVRKYQTITQVMEKIDLVSDARLFMAGYINYLGRIKKGKTKAGAHELAKYNLGYYAGYLSPSKRHFWREATGIEHPMFGTREPSPLEAFNAGVRAMELYEKGITGRDAEKIVRCELYEGRLNHKPRRLAG